MKWSRSILPSGVVVYDAPGTEWKIVARMSRTRIVGNRMVFGQWVHESDHKPYPEFWQVYRDGRPVNLCRKLRDAKAYAERRLACKCTRCGNTLPIPNDSHWCQGRWQA